MELRDVIRALRQELGLTQLELASALHVTSLTVSRWELGKSKPSRAAISLLLGYSYTHNVRKSTTEMLKTAFTELNKQTTQHNVYAGTMATEHSSLSECIDVFPFPVYVCDLETDMMLYANRMALSMVGSTNDDIMKYKCYECIMHADSPCAFCHKSSLTSDSFTPYSALRALDQKRYLVYGKLIRWNGHNAQIRFVSIPDDDNK